MSTYTARSERASRITLPTFKANLAPQMLLRGDKPTQYDVDRLADDLRRAVHDPQHTTPQTAITELGGLYEACLPYYALPGGNAHAVRLPEQTNIVHHQPQVIGGEDLRPHQIVHVGLWVRAVTRLGDWFEGETRQARRGYRLEQALVDLLESFPTVPVGDNTVKLLVGRLGGQQLSDVLLDHYAPGTTGYWLLDEDELYGLDDEDDENTQAPDLNGGNFR